MNYIEKKIPKRKDPVAYQDFDFIDSPLVEVQENDKIQIQMQYPILGFKEAETSCLLREEVAQMLYKASQSLPEGYKFRIWDAWRPFALQKELYDVYKEEIIKEFNLEDMEKEERKAFIGKFVANPKADHDLPPGHTTGGAIDLTIVGPDGNLLEMGTKFDEFTDRTQTTYFEEDRTSENPHAQEIKENRRLLFHIMEEVGFVNLPSEWWHFSFGENSWAFKEEKPALYRGIFEIDKK